MTTASSSALVSTTKSSSASISTTGAAAFALVSTTGAALDFLLAELHRKEISLAKCTTQLEILRPQLVAEVAKREKAEAEVVLLNDQADAYTEELMHLQAENARLDVTLTEAECKITEVLGRVACPTNNFEQDIINLESRSSSEDDDSSPLHEEGSH